MNAGLDKETLDMIIDSIKEFTSSELTDKKVIELDEKDEFPADIIHQMCGDGLGIHLLFIPNIMTMPMLQSIRMSTTTTSMSTAMIRAHLG